MSYPVPLLPPSLSVYIPQGNNPPFSEVMEPTYARPFVVCSWIENYVLFFHKVPLFLKNIQKYILVFVKEEQEINICFET